MHLCLVWFSDPRWEADDLKHAEERRWDVRVRGH